MEIQAQQVLKKLQQICSRQEKCPADILEYLEKNRIPEGIRETILKKLTEEKYIDEMRYARAAVQDKFRLNHWGRIKIRYFLRTKKIPADIIGDALATITDEDYLQAVEQELVKKARQLRTEEPRKKKIKLLQYAASKGFEEEIARKFLGRFLTAEPDDTW